MPLSDPTYLREQLKCFFGFDSFKGSQEAIIRTVLEGNDVFVIMPTGGGKSLCYQLPALISEGTAIIISPLIALMKNQVDAIRVFSQDKGTAHYLNSSLNKQEIQEVRNDLSSGRTKMLYVAPESLTKPENITFLKGIKISFFAIDEAHCISEWGHDFRHEYRRLKPIIAQIGVQVPTMALTATATPKVQIDIQENLEMRQAHVFKASFNRPNLYYEVRPKSAQVDKDIVRYIRERQGQSGIIYCLSRRKVDEFASTLQTNGIRALPYHAGLEPSLRAQNQDLFLMEEADVIVATIAFGMGIDKPDVRFVIHYDMPKSLEGYYQETGRAGRDGGVGECVAFYSEEDISKLESFIRKEKKNEELEVAIQLIAETVSYAETSMCRRKNILHYFGETYEPDHCDNCDNCLHPKERLDTQDDTVLVLKAMARINMACKTKHLIHILSGQMTAPIKRFEHHEIAEFGQGEQKPIHYWNSIIRQCIVSNLLEKNIEEFGTIRLSPKGRAFIHHPQAFMVALDNDHNNESADEIANSGKTEALDQTLFAMLKDLRRSISKQEGVPPFVIFSDPSLEDMTIQYPITMDEMRQISGAGAAKAAKFGQPFLDLIQTYVEQHDIERPNEWSVKSLVNKSGLKVYIIQNIDRKLPLEDIASAKGLSFSKLITELERIVASGTRLNLDYYISENYDPYHVEDIFDYFQTSEDDCAQKALETLGENDYSLDEIRLVRLQFLIDKGF